MNAVSVFKEVFCNAERVESVDVNEFFASGEISMKIKNLTDQEKEDLSHFRLNVINGIIFDDRNCKDRL